MANATAVFTPGQRLTDTDGVPFASCTVNFYQAGAMTTPYTVYADAELTVSLGSTIYTDSAGYPVTSSGSTVKTNVYATSDSYRIVCLDGVGATVFDIDNCKGAVIASASVGGSFLTQDAADVRYTRNANALATVTSLADGDTVPHWSAANAGNRGILGSDFRADLLSKWRTAGYVFSAGARVLFQGTPPTGWTLETDAAYNDAALRFTTGTPTTGGSVGFNTLFQSQTFTGTVGGTTISITTMPAHDHTTGLQGTTNASSGSGVNSSLSGSTGSTGGGSSHAHTLAMNAFNMAVKYASVNIGQKS